MSEEYVELKTKPTDMDLDFGMIEEKIRIKKEEFEGLCKDFGIYGIDWYFTTGGGLKWFDKEGWHFNIWR